MLISVIVLPVSAEEYPDEDDVYIPPYLDAAHDEHCASYHSSCCFLLPIDKAVIEATIGKTLPDLSADAIQQECAPENANLTQWCSVRFKLNGDNIVVVSKIVDSHDDLSYEDIIFSEEFGLYDYGQEGGYRRTDESTKVPYIYYCIDKLGLYSEKDREIFEEFNDAVPEYATGILVERGSSYNEHFSDEEIDVMFSGDRELVLKTFKCPGAYYYNGVVYTQYEIIQALYNHYLKTDDESSSSYESPRYVEALGVNSDFDTLNENFDEMIDSLVYEGNLFGHLVEQQAYYKKNPVGYNEYLLEALIIKLSEDYPDVEIPTAPQTGISTALLAVAALVSGAYVVKKRRR